MPAVTPSFIFDFESGLQVIQVNEYARMLKKLWWRRVAKYLTSKSKREIIGWLLDTATISAQGKGGNVMYEDMTVLDQTIENTDAGKGLRLRRQQFEDLDEHGVEIGTKWAADIGAYMAYWPQKLIANTLKAGSSTVGYDGKNLFSSSTAISSTATGAHPFNPNDTGLGGFANWFTGVASGSYPGACPIDATNAATVDTALTNLNKVIAYVKGAIKMPSGQDPRFLEPTLILHPPALTARVQQLTNARFIAQAAGASGGGSGDVDAVIRNYGFGEPIEAPELSAANGGSDTTYYVVCEEQAAGDQLGALVYQEREPFKVRYFSGLGGGADAIDHILARADELEWLVKGRNATAPGHPFLIFRVDAT